MRALKSAEMHQKVDFFTLHSFHHKQRFSQPRTTARARRFSARHLRNYFQVIVNTCANPYKQHIHAENVDATPEEVNIRSISKKSRVSSEIPHVAKINVFLAITPT